MGASNTSLFDLIELSAINANATFTTAPGGGGDIIGFVDTATYTDSEGSNSSTQITEINETTDADHGVLTIDGIDYNIEIYTPQSTSDPVTVTYDGGATIDLTGDDGTSQVAWIVASPVGGGSDRYFMAIDDSVGDLSDITSIQIRDVDVNPAGDDVKINLDQDNNVTACLAAGTLVDTPEGARPVEAIAPGDLVTTLDHGLRPVLWVFRETLHFGPGGTGDQHRPIRIQRGALGPGLPLRPLLVSPQHRVLLASKIVRRICAHDAVFVPAVKLTAMPGIARDSRTRRVTYVHLFLGSHEVILADGAPVESFLPERQALLALPEADRTALLDIVDTTLLPARPIIETGPQIRELLRRHRKNTKPLCHPALIRHVPERRKTPRLRVVAG